MSNARRGSAIAMMALAIAVSLSDPAAADGLTLYAAGSLREAMGDVARVFGAAHELTVTTAFGPSGLMRERIEKGEKVDLFTSADLGHPLKLKADGRADYVAMFARNAVCAVSRRGLGLTPATMLDRLLDPAVTIGTSTPKADPLGDYTLTLFHRAEALRAGAESTLVAKAKAIFGGATNNGTPEGADPVVASLQNGTADIVFAYCSNRERLTPQLPDLAVTELPPELRVGPEYGLAVLHGADAQAKDLALFILSPDGQALLAKRGFLPVTLPQE